MIKGNDLGKDNIFRLVLALALPAMLSQLVSVLYGIVDRIFIGNISQIGDLALAGVGICGPITSLLASFATLVGLGGSILMSISLGEKNKSYAKAILSNSFSLLIVLSLLLTIIFLLTKKHLLYFFGATALTFPYANDYLTIYTLGTFFALLSVGLNYFITCQGFPNISMACVLISTLTNIILDPLLIFYFDLKISGAAIATVISQIISCLIALYFLLGPKPTIKISIEKIDLNIIKKIISVGFSPFLILATDSVLLIVMNIVLKHFGQEQSESLIASFTIIQSYMFLITGPLIGISGGTQAIISYNYGAKNILRIKQAFKYILILCLIFTTLMFIISQTIPQVFVKIFTDNPQYQKLAIEGIKIYTLAVIFLSFQYVFVDGLTALYRIKTALALSLLRKTTFILFTIAIPLFMEINKVFYAEALSDFICALITTIVFIKIFDRHLKKRVQSN